MSHGALRIEAAVSLLTPFSLCYRRLLSAMRIQCPNCPAAYELDDGRVPPAGLSIKCPKCKTPFTVHREKAADGKGAGQKVPLPGTGAQPSRPSAGAKPPGAKGVAFPGGQVATGAPRVAAGAVPLPGHGDAVPRPPPRPNGDPFGAPAMGAVPLPGLDDELPAPSPGGAM